MTKELKECEAQRAVKFEKERTSMFVYKTGIFFFYFLIWLNASYIFTHHDCIILFGVHTDRDFEFLIKQDLDQFGEILHRLM